ncbi:Rsp5p-dependent ubiquitination, sorting of cargo proteins at the multivesicular body [Meristemomyces frigidus]|nr:Rsp5p-dependent ubiquitination, sorting of cargo proteins at the multivesicular body [Meristemomyces frigidus]
MAQRALLDGAWIPTMATSYVPSQTSAIASTPSHNGIEWQVGHDGQTHGNRPAWWEEKGAYRFQGLGSTGKGILIGMLSAFGSAALVGLMIAIVYFFRYTNRGRILLDRIGRPGEFDDEQQFLREEEEALAEMDDMQRAEYHRAKCERYTSRLKRGASLTETTAFVQVNPPESAQTDISLSQFLAIQEKGVSAWEFEPELEIANCFVEARTEIEFFDSECSVQSNLPIPKQNEVYYWESKLYDKPESTTINIGLTTKPYPLFRLPGFHRTSIAYTSSGHRRFNQPFTPTAYGPTFVQGDVIGVGYRPRTGTVFFTRNGKKLDDVAHGLKSQNFFPTVGANGPCSIHVNFGQMGFVFIEANVKKWGLAPMTGSLAPPPPYGSEAGSILLEGGREGIREGQGYIGSHGRTNSAQIRLQGRPARSPGPQRSPTDISLAQLNLMDSMEEDDIGEGTSETPNSSRQEHQLIHPGLPCEPHDHPPPDYESPEDDYDNDGDESVSTPRASEQTYRSEERPLLGESSPPIPTYEAATGDVQAGRGRSATRNGQS